MSHTTPTANASTIATTRTNDQSSCTRNLCDRLDLLDRLLDQRSRNLDRHRFRRPEMLNQCLELGRLGTRQRGQLFQELRFCRKDRGLLARWALGRLWAHGFPLRHQLDERSSQFARKRTVDLAGRPLFCFVLAYKFEDSCVTCCVLWVGTVPLVSRHNLPETIDFTWRTRRLHNKLDGRTLLHACSSV